MIPIIYHPKYNKFFAHSQYCSVWLYSIITIHLYIVLERELTRESNIEIKFHLIRMGSVLQLVEFVFKLEIYPGVNQIVGEDTR